MTTNSKTSRRYLRPIALNVLALALGSIWGMAAQAQSCATTISGSTTACNLTAGENLTISSSASISSTGTTAGVMVNSGITAGSIINHGSINASQVGIDINNYGAITNGIVNYGTILIGTATSNTFGIVNASTIAGGITNYGTISGVGYFGIANLSRSAISGGITNSGTISGSIAAIFNGNGGTISGGIANSGTLNGMIESYGAIDFVNNSGTISGASYAMNLYSISSLTGTLANSGSIKGNIANNSGTTTTLTIQGGTGTTFGILTGYGDTTANGAGTQGAIYSTRVNFSGGNTLLNDNIAGQGGAPATSAVTNTGAVLQLNQPVTITGNYTQTAGTLQIGAVTGTSQGGSGQLTVTGNTSMTGGSVNITPAGYALATGQRYIAVVTQGTANYSGLSYTATGFAATGQAVSDATTPSYTDLLITLGAPTASPASPSGATAPNAVSSLYGLQNYPGANNTALGTLRNAMLGAMNGASTAQANQIGRQIGPTVTSKAPMVSTDDALDVLSRHLNDTRIAQGDGGTGIATGEASSEWTAWGQAYGGHANQSQRDQVDGYGANYGGLMMGADRAFGPRWRAGAALTYSNTNIGNTGDTTGSGARVNSYGLIGYADYAGDPWYLNLSASAEQQNYAETRLINSIPGANGSASGSFTGQSYSLRAEGGYPFNAGWATLTPLASLQYGYIHQNAYTESGTNALSIRTSNVNSVQSRLGARLEKTYQTGYGQLVPSLQLQWVHEYVNSGQRVNASFVGDATGQTAFTTVGPSPVRDMADLALGVTLMRSNNLSLSARYEVQAGAGFVAQAGMLRLQQRF